MMVMQLMNMIPANRSSIQRESMGSMISGLIQKKSYNLKNSFRKLRNKLPSMATPSSRPGNQSISNQSDDNGIGCGFFSKLTPKDLFNNDQGYIAVQ